MSLLSSIIATNIVISLISLIGLASISFKFLKKQSTSVLLVSFAAGVLLATAVLNILPEALEGLPTFVGLSWFMYGLIIAFFMERFLLWYHHHHDDTHDINPTASLVIAGDAIHNFIDGLTIAAAFLTHPTLGITTAVAIAAHELPQELADYSVLRHCGMSRKQALMWNFISALTAVLGGIIGFYLFQDSFILAHYALAVTAGILLYVAVADLIPELHHSDTKSGWALQSIVFVVGISLMFLLTQNAPHSHAHDNDVDHSDDMHMEELHEDEEHESEDHLEDNDHDDSPQYFEETNLYN